MLIEMMRSKEDNRWQTSVNMSSINTARLVAEPMGTAGREREGQRRGTECVHQALAEVKALLVSWLSNCLDCCNRSVRFLNRFPVYSAG